MKLKSSNNAPDRIRDCVVIGAGPGGIVASLYLQRMRRDVLLIDGGPPRALKIPKIRNLVGYDDGISGVTLIERLKKQYAKWGGVTICGRALVRRTNRLFEIKVGEQTLKARKVILATGMRDTEPALGNIPELTAKGLVGYCPICDGFDHRDQKIALMVRDTKSLKKIRFMSAFSEDLVVVVMCPVKVHPFHKKLARDYKVKVVNRPPKRIIEDKKRGGLIFDFGRAQLHVDAAYVMMGSQVPKDATARMRGLKRTTGGYITVTSHQETSVPGLYAVGDCVQALSQVSVAAGHAAIAATHVHNSLPYEAKI